MKNSIRYLLIVLCLLIAFLFGFDMSERYRADLLWGYRPLVLLIGLWGALVLVLAPFLAKSEKKWRWLGLSTLSGFLLAAGFPDTIMPVPLLLFIGFVPLLLVEREITAWRGKTSMWAVSKYAYHTFVIWNILTTYWVANTALAAGLFAILVNSALMCIPFALFHATRRAMPQLGYVAFAAFWIVFEYGHLNWDLTWPWLTLGNGFAEWPALVQWYEYTGVFGGGLWILLLNILFLRGWVSYRNGQPYGRNLLRAALLMILPMALSLFMYSRYEEEPRPVEVVLVQPNFEPHYEKFTFSEEQQVTQAIRLAAAKVDKNTDYVLFPETVFGWFELDNANEYPAVKSIRDGFAAFPGLRIISGVQAYHDLSPGEPRSRATRQRSNREGKRIDYELYNAAVQITIGEAEVPYYKKSRLVPGPEIFPFRDLFFWLKPFIDKLGGTWEGFGTQRQRSVFASPEGRIGPAICYESVFGEYVTGYIRQGAQAIFIMTNDGWWDNTAGHRQHLHFASLRAIETRRSIARAANTGISAFINQRGDILEASRYDQQIALKGAINLNDTITFYVRWGDIIARLAIFTAIILILNTVVKGLMRGKETEELKN